MYFMQQPSLNLAHLAPLPKYPLHRLSPVLQSTRSQPRTGTVTWMTPPVHPSQYPPSTMANGVYSTATLQQGLWRDLADVIQTRGSCRSQVWSPSKGLQLLHENLPAQLLLQLGHMVAWKVRPFLIGLRLNSLTFEIPPQETALAQVANRSTVSAKHMAFINLSTNYYSKQKITADQYFPPHIQKNITKQIHYRYTFFDDLRFFQKTFWIKITALFIENKRRNLQQRCRLQPTSIVLEQDISSKKNMKI